jgi:hypothetical protein
MKINKNILRNLGVSAIILAATALFMFCIYKALVATKNSVANEIAQATEKAKSDTMYNLKHPIIVGTNDLGEIVTMYKVEQAYHTHYIYRVGNTKTTIIPATKGKDTVVIETN